MSRTETGIRQPHSGKAMTGFTAADPQFEQRVRGSFARQPFMGFLGATLEAVAPGVCEIHLVPRQELTQQHGFVHGGVLASLVDTAAGYAAFSLMPADAAPLTVEYKLNILRPGGGERLVTRAHVIKPGRSLSVVQADCFNLREGREQICVTSIQTLMTMTGWDDGRRT